MSSGILTSFDDLVRRRGGGDVFSPLSMTPFQSSTHAFLCLYSPWQREREEKEFSVLNLEGSHLCEILYAIWVRVCLPGWRTTHKKMFCARLSVTWSDQRVIACMVFILGTSHSKVLRQVLSVNPWTFDFHKQLWGLKTLMLPKAFEELRGSI